MERYVPRGGGRDKNEKEYKEGMKMGDREERRGYEKMDIDSDEQQERMNIEEFQKGPDRIKKSNEMIKYEHRERNNGKEDEEQELRVTQGRMKPETE